MRLCSHKLRLRSLYKLATVVHFKSPYLVQRNIESKGILFTMYGPQKTKRSFSKEDEKSVEISNFVFAFYDRNGARADLILCFFKSQKSEESHPLTVEQKQNPFASIIHDRI